MKPPAAAKALPPAAGALAPLAGAAAALAISLALTPRVLGIGDPAEFTLVLAVAGVPHPTGYPLYVLLGSPLVQALHALGVDWVRAAAAWSALGAACTAGFLIAAGRRMTGGSGRPRGAAFLLPALLIALHPVVLHAASEAEVHTWWYAWCAAAAWFALGRLQALHAEGEEVALHRALGTPAPGRSFIPAALAWGLLCGAGLAHHAASLTFIAPLTAALAIAATRARALTPAHAGSFALGALAPLAVYGFVAWRAVHPAVYQWPLEPGLASVLAHARGAAYTFYVGGWAPNPADRALLEAAVFPLLVAGLLGGALLAFRSRDPVLRAWLAALLAAAALLIAFVFNYAVPDPARYFVPALMVAALAAAPAFAALERRFSPAVAGVLLVAVALGMGSWGTRLTIEENRRRALADARIRAAWLAIPEDPAIVTWHDDHVNRLKLYQVLGGERRDLYVENPNRLTWPVARRAFAARFGFDPLEGFAIAGREDLARLPAHLRARAPVPVLDFPDLLERGRPAEPER